MKLSIVIPAYNEEYRLGAMLDAYLPFFRDRIGERDAELIVVVNGSTDGTAALAADYARHWPMLRVLVEPASIGKGGAVMLGLREAVGAMAGYVDADGATPPAAFLELVERVQASVPVVIASRWCPGARVFPPQPPLRRLASRVFNFFTRMLFGLRLHDTQCGAKVFHRCALERVFKRPGIITRWAFDVDLLYQIRREGLPILEVPTEWHDVEGSKLMVTETSLEMLAALVRLRLMYSPLHRVVDVYNRFLSVGRTTEEVLRQRLLSGLGGQVTNGFNLLFQMLAAQVLVRRAGGEAEVYGDLAAALAMATLLHSVLGGVLVRPPSTGRPLPGPSAGRLGGWGAALPAVLFLALPVVGYAGPIAAALGMASPLPVYLGVALGMAGVFHASWTSCLEATRRHRSAALFNVLHSMMRMMAAGLLLALGFGVTGVLSGALSAAVIAGVATALPAVRHRQPDGAGGVPGLVVDGYPALPMAGFALLSVADILVVKARFAPSMAGEYALAAMMARIVFFLPMPLAAAAFSRGVGAADPADRRREWATVLFSILIPAGLMVLLADVLARLMTGSSPGATVPLLRALTVAYLPLPLLSLVLRYGLSRRWFRAPAAVLPAGALAFVMAALLPAAISRTGVVFVLGTVNLACLIALCALYRHGVADGGIEPSSSRSRAPGRDVL